MASVCMAVHLDHVLAYQRLVQYMYSTSTSTRCDYGDCPTSIGEAALSAHPSRTCRLRSHSSDDDNALMNRWAMMMRTRERERGRERTSEVKCNYRAPIPPTPTLHSAAAPLPPVRPHIRTSSNGRVGELHLPLPLAPCKQSTCVHPSICPLVDHTPSSTTPSTLETSASASSQHARRASSGNGTSHVASQVRAEGDDPHYHGRQASTITTRGQGRLRAQDWRCAHEKRGTRWIPCCEQRPTPGAAREERERG
jgi:hypothetical protein